MKKKTKTIDQIMSGYARESIKGTREWIDIKKKERINRMVGDKSEEY